MDKRARRVGPAAALAVGMLLGTAPTANAQLQSVPYVTGLSSPVGMVQDPSDPSIQYVVQQGGLVRIIRNGTLQAAPFIDLTQESVSGGESGLLGLAFPADYARSGRFYVNFTREPDGATVIARFRRSASNPLAADKSTRLDLLWPAMPDANCPQPAEQRAICQPYSNHNGGKVVFGPDGYLYIGMGDGGSGGDPQNQAQAPQTLLGKILRVDVSVPLNDTRGYRIPADNPYVGNDPLGALDEIWAFGIRNPWRVTFDEPIHGGTGALTMGDVGQSGSDSREEIDYEPARRGGRNYGWPRMEGSRTFDQNRTIAFLPLVNPIHEYNRSVGASITGGYVYRGSALGALYQGRYFYADYISGRMFSVALAVDPVTREATASDEREHTAEINTPGNISSLDVDSFGEIYIVKYSGEIRRLVLTNGDGDSDGLADAWEVRYGLNPASGAGADGFTGDPDGDGVPNNVELANGTHPRGFSPFSRFLAEGASSSFFDTSLALANPGTQPARVLLRILREDGVTVPWPVMVAPKRRLTVHPGQLGSVVSSAFSTIVESDREVIVERTMRWDEFGYGAHAEKALAGPATNWYFAEGSQGFFFTFVLLTNPASVPNRARVRFLIEGGTPFEETVTVAPLSRYTFDPGGYAPLRNRSFGIEVTFLDQPGAAERAMYFGEPPDVLWKAGHESAGVTAPATEWFLAEGATGPYFETFVLAANPNAQTANVTLTFLTGAGQTFTRQKTVPANGRLTVNLETEGIPELANAAVATRVTSDIPIVVERAQYWPGPPGLWLEAHNAFGVTQAGTRWGLAEGHAGLSDFAQTYILIANNNASAVSVSIEFIRETDTPLVRTFDVPANSRFNVPIGPFGTVVPELNEERFGAVVTSSAPVVVERAVYYSRDGIIWSAGSNATATPLP
jgi:glucose/arabinose dehydrogenase